MVLPPRNIFREYDIRGIIGKELNAENAELIGKAFGGYLQKISGKNVVISCDNRKGGEELKQAFANGMALTGCKVDDLGTALSPMLYYAVCRFGYDGGVSVTGSHNPKGYSGFKMVEKKARALFGKEIAKLYETVKAKKFAKGNGRVSQRNDTQEIYINEIAERIRLKKPIKIVLDCGNGTASFFAPKLLKKIGCKVIEQCCESDPEFPNHLPDPEVEANVEDLKRRVVEECAELGVALDGDGDRVGIVDETGKKWHAEYLLLLLARDLLKRRKNAKIVLDIKSSMVLFNEIKKLGGRPMFWKAGHSLMKQKMREEKALLGGELSGHIFFAEDYYGFDDASYAACRILEYHSAFDVPFSEHFKGLQQMFSTHEIKLPCPDDKKFAVVEKVKKHFLKKYPKSLKVDGIRIVFGKNDWALVRASNTNPYLTLRFEAEEKQKLEEIQKIVREKLKEFKTVDLSRWQ